MKEFNLLIDDIRTEEMCGVTDIKFDYIARNAKSGMKALQSYPVTHLWLDNDLGYRAMEGWEILNWARDHGLLPDHVIFVTANPVSKRRMQETIENDLGYTRTSINSPWWNKPSITP
jgi:hypothetical protein